MGIREWATRGLYRGDLKALKRIAKGERVDDASRLARLCRRNFIAGSANHPRVTFSGRAALIARSLTAH